MDSQNYSAPQNLLTGKVIAVTGAGDGIGAVAAKTFASFGATVILMGRTVPKLEKVYDHIESAGWPQPAIYPICLEGASEKDYEDMHDRLEEAFGKLDGLLHNAGELGQRTPIANYKLSTWQKVMQINVTAEFMMTKALLPLLEKSDSASIIFTTSGVGRVGKPFWGAYAISKFATEGMSQVLANELEDISNIRVNCINPGATRTRMRATAFPAEDPSTVKMPEDIMPLYLYLMGKDSEGMTGQSMDAQ
ncbi:MAG: YciK family oxidoreductase [Porticoccus sp.]|nr:YciK family oxidoreductase [Porticoccus sp.]MBQ0806773.1 YciK family oxidoreductase [Porticoccus sp.]